MPKERWLPVVGFKGLYEVSNLGRVRSLTRKAVNSKRSVRGRILAQTMTPQYLSVHLSKGSKKKRTAVHILVLLAFVGPRPRGMQARHFPDRDTTNNKLGNLSWATPRANQRDRDVHGTHNKGERNASAKLTSSKVTAIRKIKHWPHGSLTAKAKQYGVSRTIISYARDRKSWKHLP